MSWKTLEKSGLEPTAPNRLADRKHCFIDSAKSPSTKRYGSLVNFRRRLSNRHGSPRRMLTMDIRSWCRRFEPGLFQGFSRHLASGHLNLSIYSSDTTMSYPSQLFPFQSCLGCVYTYPDKSGYPNVSAQDRPSVYTKTIQVYAILRNTLWYPKLFENDFEGGSSECPTALRTHTYKRGKRTEAISCPCLHWTSNLIATL